MILYALVTARRAQTIHAVNIRIIKIPNNAVFIIYIYVLIFLRDISSFDKILNKISS